MRLHMLAAVFISCVLATVAEDWSVYGEGRCEANTFPLSVPAPEGFVFDGEFSPEGNMYHLTRTTLEECAELCLGEEWCEFFSWKTESIKSADTAWCYISSDCNLVYSDNNGYDNDSWKYTTYIINPNSVFSQVAAPGECLTSDNNDIGMVLGNNPHTIRVRLTFPDSAPSLRQWILNLGQYNNGAHHWIWDANIVQFGTWNGYQIQAVDITQCTDLTTTHSGSVLKLYCNGVFLAETDAQFSIDTSMLSIGTIPFVGGPEAADAAFAGCISEVAIWSYEKSAEEVAQQSPPAFWETCRWETIQDQNLANTDETNDYLGYTCADNEILTGFGLTANENDVTKIQCCELGGHTSVVPNSCTFIAAGGEQGFQPEAASCDASNHMVFSGAYDKRVAAGDEITELLAGKCCEVKCDTQWCAGRDWGVSDQCETLSVDPSDNGAQNLVCPMGTLLTEIRDGFAGGAHGLQSVESVVCCELDLIAQPTMAPSTSPTTPPSPSPTTAPSLSPTQAPTSTAECLLGLHHAALTSAQFLDGVDRCLPSCEFNHHRRALEGRLLPEKIPFDLQY